MAFGNGSRQRQVTVPARDPMALEEAIAKAKERFGLAAEAPVVSCYEAGRDGFRLHRHLHERGIANQVVDSASIQVDRRRRRAKTDRLDARRLLEMLRRWARGERDVVHVPDEQAEGYVQNTIDEPRGLYRLSFDGAKVRTWRMPLPEEPQEGIWHQRYYQDPNIQFET